MSDEQAPEPDKAAGEMILIQAAAMLLQGAQKTGDPRVADLAAAVINELKKGNILETLLIALASQQQQQPVRPFTQARTNVVNNQQQNMQEILGMLNR